MKTLNKVLPLSLDFTKSSSFKDFEVNKIIQHRPQLQGVIDQLSAFLPKRKFLTIDYSELLLHKGSKTCKNPLWHVDGEGNDYIILNFGDFRTRFLHKPMPDFKSDSLKALNNLIAEKFVCEEGKEIQEGVPVLYSSLDIHKGNVATYDSKRILLRLCSSDYLCPKNAILIK